VKGSYQLEAMKLFDSVQTIERTKYSEKLEKFREIIETLYPGGRKINFLLRDEKH